MIPVCEPLLGKNEIKYITECLETNWISSSGKYIEEFENCFSEYCQCKYGICTTSGTTALHLAMACINLQPGDEVIVPTFTNVATAFAVVYCGATPVLVDSERETWNLDVSKIEEKITLKTRAIMPVHIYGHPCDMDPILEIASKHGLYVVEDAAEAHGAEYKGKKAGGIGHINCFSFFANKIITTGEGGMVVTNDESLAERARLLRNLAHAKGQRFLHTDIAFNYRITNIQAAIGLAQFENIEEFIDRRRKNAQLYNEKLKDVKGVTLPVEKDWAKNVYWMYSIVIEDEFGLSRDEFAQKLHEKEIETRTFFVPMHKLPAFLNIGLFENESYPVAEEIGKKGLYLPSGSGLTLEQIEYICETIREIKPS